MTKDLLNFNGINWWTLLGGLGLNFVIATLSSLGGTFLAVNETTASFYANYGPVLMILVIFIACGLAGFMVAKVADDVPLKHALWSSMGAVAPYVAMAVMSFNPLLLMMGAIALAGDLNGAMLAAPKKRYHGPQR